MMSLRMMSLGRIAGLSLIMAVPLVYGQQAPPPPGTQAPDTQTSDTQTEARQDKSASADEALAAAESDIAAKNFDAARPKLEKLLREHPADARGLFDLGYVEDEQEHFDDAAADYRKAIATDPKQFESRVALGLMLARQGQNDEAREQLAAAANLEPVPPSPEAKAQALRALARLDRSSDPSAAKAALLKALSLTHETVDDTLLTAEIAEASGDDETALAAYRRVLARQPDSSAATAGLVHLLLKDKKYAEAEPLLRSALNRDPDDPALNSQLATTLTAEDKQAEAITVLEKLHQIEPANPQVTAMLADAYTQSGNAVKADPLFVELLKNSPQNPELLVSRGDNLIRQQRYSEALPLLQQAVKLKPDDADGWSNLAFAASELKQDTVTLESLTMRSKYLEDTPATYFLRATAYDNLHQTKQAAEYYKKFLQAAHGSFPTQEWQAQHRLIALEKH